MDSPLPLSLIEATPPPPPSRRRWRWDPALYLALVAMTVLIGVTGLLAEVRVGDHSDVGCHAGPIAIVWGDGADRPVARDAVPEPGNPARGLRA